MALRTCSDEKTTEPLNQMELYDHKQKDVLTDLSCDLMHHAHIDEAMKFQEALEHTRMQHEAELAGEVS